MSNNVSTDEFETVKQLLASAARYAESSHQRLDQVSIQQQQATQETRELRQSIREQRESQKEAQDHAEQERRELRAAQKQTEQSLRELSEAQKKTEATVERVGQRLESFMFEAQRLITKHAESIEQLKGMNERLDGVLAHLIRKEQRGE